MNILVVDDNKNNRMILTLLLEDYLEENSELEFTVDEAVDGVEAVAMCDKLEYDLIFMDIMMPNMDGIEATKHIRQKHKKSMLVAVSAVGDGTRKKEILHNGAEDYILKPVNADIFSRRVANYINLIHYRQFSDKGHLENHASWNLFTQKIYNRYMKFRLSSEDALSELWEYYLLDGDEHCDGISDVIRMVFSLGEAQIKLGIAGFLVVEVNEREKYFTVVHIKNIPTKVIQLLLRKNEISCEYKRDNDRISFKLVKVITPDLSLALNTPGEQDITPPLESPKQEPLEQVEDLDVHYTSTTLEVYDYIEGGDMMDLEEYVGRLSSLMLMVGNGDLTQDEAIEIYTYIEKIGSILATYSEVYPISKALTTLAFEMSTNIETFIQNSEALGPMCTAFSADISNWMEQSFHTGAPSVAFMNDTIAVNCQTIGSMLKMDEIDEGESEDFDDIFDF